MKNIKYLFTLLLTLFVSVCSYAEKYPFAPIQSASDLDSPDSCDIILVYKTATNWYAVNDCSASTNANVNALSSLANITSVANKTSDVIEIDPSNSTHMRYIWKVYGSTSKLLGSHGWLTVNAQTKSNTSVYSLGYAATAANMTKYDPVTWQLPTTAAGGVVTNTATGLTNPNLTVPSGSSLKLGTASTTWCVYRRANKVAFVAGVYADSVSPQFSFDKMTLPSISYKHTEYGNYMTFKGWSKAPNDASQIVGIAGGTLSDVTDMTLYAIYEISNFTVTFDAGDYGYCDTKKIEGILPFPMPQVTVDGGTYFKGWKLKGTSLIYQPGSIYPGETAITLTSNAAFEAVYEHVFDVLEWKKDTVIINYEFDADKAVTHTTYGTDRTMNLADCKLDIGIYQLVFTPGDLDPESSASMTLSFYKGTTLVNKSTMNIPVVVTGNAQTSDYDKMTCSATNLVVQRGATFTVSGGNTPTYTFKDIFVYGGGKLVVPTGTMLICNNVYMQGGMLVGSGTTRTYQFIYPQIVVNGSLTNKSKKIYYDYMLNNAQMYTITLPYPVTTSDIMYNTGVKAVQGTDFGVRFYDGAARATGATGWTGLADGAIMQAGQGYTIWGLPRELRIGSGEQITGRQKYAYLRLPMAADLSSGETTQNKTITVQAHTATKDNDAGWNLVGNPYLANFDGSLNGLTNNGIGLLKDDGEGNYYWSDNVRYIVMPNDNGTYYYPYKASAASLPAFKNFFIQIGSGDQLIFPLSSRAQKSPAYRMDEFEPAEPMAEAGITLTRQSTSEVETVGVLVDEDYSMHYEIGFDLEKFLNPAGFNLYAVSDSVNLSFVATSPSLAARMIPLELTAKYRDNYTFAIDRSYDLNRIQSLYLTDMLTGTVTNLLTDVYKVRLNSITNGQVNTIKGRFYLSFEGKQPAPTDVDNLQSVADGAYVVAEQQGLHLKNLPQASQIYVYDAAGRLLVHESCVAPEAVYELPGGVYSVRVVSDESNSLLRALVR